MRLTAISALLLAVLASPGVFAQGGGEEEDPIVKLKKILARMEQVEELLAKTRLAEGSTEQSEIIKALEQKVKEGKLKQEDVVAEADKQLQIVLKKMQGIDEEIEKVIQMAKLQKGGGGSGMDMKNPKDKDAEKQGEKRKEEKGDLKEMKPEDREKQAGKEKGKEGEKEGEKKEGGEGGKDPADKPYNAEGRDAAGGAKRADAGGRWGSLPLKEFNEALASGKIKAPEKYLNMIRKYMEMLAKKAAEEK